MTLEIHDELADSPSLCGECRGQFTPEPPRPHHFTSNSFYSKRIICRSAGFLLFVFMSTLGLCSNYRTHFVPKGPFCGLAVKYPIVQPRVSIHNSQGTLPAIIGGNPHNARIVRSNWKQYLRKTLLLHCLWSTASSAPTSSKPHTTMLAPQRPTHTRGSNEVEFPILIKIY